MQGPSDVIRPPGHSAYFYLGAYPCARVGDFVAAGLLAGDACVVLLSAPHRHAVEHRLHARGIRTDAPRRQPGSYRAIDTDTALSALPVDGHLDMQRARDLLAGVLPPPERGGPRARAVCDLAPKLLAAGRPGDAFAFEELVDTMAAAHGAVVYCAYPIDDFCREGHTQSLFRICGAHASLEFPERPWAHGFMPPSVAMLQTGKAGARRAWA